MTMKILHFLTSILIIVLLVSPSFIQAAPVLAANGCVSSSPASGAYTVTICIASPLDDSVLIGNATVTATASITGTNPGVQRMIFYINGFYLLTDFSSPYTFTLPSNKWADGSYNLTASTLMRDGFSSSAALITVTLNNGYSTAPVNTNHFQPSSGTSPVSGQPFVVAAAGDGASGEASAAKVANTITSLNPNLFLYLGDVYESGSMAEFYNWYGTSSSNFGVLRAITDPTIGNHEYGNSIGGIGYFDYWNNVPNYYSFNAGGWHFISLNSNYTKIGVTPTSAQYLWLQQDLAANAQACTIVYYHQPLFNIGPEGPTTAMASFWSLMAQYEVSIVLNGHDHDYQRWVPLDGNGNPSPTGITEFIAGGGGHGLLTISSSDSRVAYSNYLNPAAFGVLLLQLSGTGANYSYHSSNGSILDSGFVPCVNAGSTPTPTATIAVTNTPTPTSTATQTATSTSTPIPTATQIATSTSTSTSTPSATVTQVAISTFTPTPTATPTATQIPINTPTSTPTVTIGTSLVTFIPVADTYVNAGSTTTNYGSSTTMRLDSSPDNHAYLRFSLSGFANTTINKVLLKLYANNTDSSGIRAFSVADNTWGELTMNYTNAPALGAQLASSGSFSSVGWVTLDVTSYITGDGTYSFGVTNLSSTAISVNSRESGANAPQLIITYSGALSPTFTPTPAFTPTSTNTPAPTATSTPTSVFTPTATSTQVATPAATPTATPTSGPVNTPTPTFTPVPSPTPTSTPVVSSVTFIPVADTYVDAANPSINHGTSTTLRLDGSPDVHAYQRFTITGVSGTITQVRLLLFANNSDSSGIRLWSVIDNTWGELTMTYSNAPALGAQIASLGSFAAGWVTLDVTSYITGNGTYNIGVTNLSSTAISVDSRESGTNTPQLVITYH
jgi:hypothetical protein